MKKIQIDLNKFKQNHNSNKNDNVQLKSNKKRNNFCDESSQSETESKVQFIKFYNSKNRDEQTTRKTDIHAIIPKYINKRLIFQNKSALTTNKKKKKNENKLNYGLLEFEKNIVHEKKKGIFDQEKFKHKTYYNYHFNEELMNVSDDEDFEKNLPLKNFGKSFLKGLGWEPKE